MKKTYMIVKPEFWVYNTENGKIRIQVTLSNDTLWLSAMQMADLFDIDVSGVRKHLRNIFESGELERESVSAFFASTATDGKTYLNQDELDILNRKAGKDLRDHTTSCARPGFPSKSRPSEEEQAGQIETEF